MSDRRSPVDQALDLLLYAPLGFLFNATEVVPQLVEKGRAQVKLARVFGHYAVDKRAPQLLSRLQRQAVSVMTGRPGQPRPAAETAPSGNGTAAPDTPSPGPVSATMSLVTEVSERRRSASGEADTLAIPDYDSLSASQVLPRLDGLSRAELEAVGAYEAGHRGRQTILHRVAQLQAG